MQVVQLLRGEDGPAELELQQKPGQGGAVIVNACDLQDHTSSSYLNELIRHRQLLMEWVRNNQIKSNLTSNNKRVYAYTLVPYSLCLFFFLLNWVLLFIILLHWLLLYFAQPTKTVNIINMCLSMLFYLTLFSLNPQGVVGSIASLLSVYRKRASHT